MTLRRLRHALLAVLLLAGVALAQVPVPALSGRVVDQTGSLAPDAVAALDRKLAAFEARKGSQLAVLVVATTAPEAIEQFSIRVADQWKLGRKKVDDGAILVVALQDRTLRIEVGYGLEGALTDVTCRRIIDEVIVPRLRQGDVAGALDAGTDRIIGVIDGEPLPAPAPGAGGDAQADRSGSVVGLLVLAAVVLSWVLPLLIGRLAGSLATGGAVAALAWWNGAYFAFGLVAGVCASVFTLAGGLRMSGGGFGGGGGGGGFGGGGGGFGGGGGGGFGGGGASGRW